MGKEKFSIGKLLDFSPLGFYKLAGLGIKLTLIVFLILGVVWVKNIMFPKASTVKDIHVGSGGKVIINEDKRRLEPFIFGYGSSDNEGDLRLGVGGGVKW